MRIPTDSLKFILMFYFTESIHDYILPQSYNNHNFTESIHDYIFTSII